MRRRLAFIALFALLLPLLSLTPPQAVAQEGDVPMFRGNAARTGQMPGPGPEGSSIEAWRVAAKSGGTFSPAMESSPAVVDGTVHVGSLDRQVYALDAATGQEQWHVDTGDAVGASPAVVGGMVYVGSQDGNVYAIAGDGRMSHATGV